MSALIRSEFIKLRTTRTALALFLVVLILSVVPELLYALLISPDSALDHWSASVGTSVQLAGLFGLIFGILGITGEYRYGTITYTYLTAPRRGRVVIVKLVVYALFGALLTLTALLVANLVLGVVFAIRGIELQPVADQLGSYARQVVAAGLMTAFGVALGALIRNQVLAIAGTLIWAFVVELMISLWAPTVGACLPFAALATVTNGPVGGDTGGFELSSVAAFFVVLAYIGAFSVAALLTSLRRDVT